MGLLRTGVPTVGAIPVSMMGGGAAALGAVIAYLLRATFNAPNQGFADGQVLDTDAEGVQDGRLVVKETAGTVALVANELLVDFGGAWTDNVVEPDGLSRSLGLALLLTFKYNTFGNDLFIGLSWLAIPSAGSTRDGGFTIFGVALGPAGHIEFGFNVAYNTPYQVASVIGGYDANGVPWHSGETPADYLYGFSLYFKGGVLSDWTLLWREETRDDGTLYPAIIGKSPKNLWVDNFRVPDADLSAVLEPLAKSTFTAANGTSLDAITPEVGGAWTERTGNFDIQTNRSNISASTGVRDVATVPATVADLYARMRIRKTVAADSGEFGHCLRWTDADNFWMVQGDLTNDQMEIIERNGGVETQRAVNAVVLTHSTDYDVIAIAYAQTIKGFLNSSDPVTYTAAALNENVTVHGTVGNQVGQTFDDYHINARTDPVYDATFDAY